jgi:hypothetical protein
MNAIPAVAGAKGVVAVRLVRRRVKADVERTAFVETAAKPSPTRVSLAWQSSPLQ